ncbi:alpha/beta fold hydrolase [Natronosporangium hydrolyticum]|uniref:Alpha/beta fold hydrolase n=1 Tax=Natronosporangium hydrolyticum TaxID=2811111 RepID=A0A895YG92_9ACTN|nr:alpha/beta fold hydrolase [Natronosporangium hydrolyticum]QSB15095.1 alpha/beta fold hydrolase [Natronosporangium hydrolyticum]
MSAVASRLRGWRPAWSRRRLVVAGSTRRRLLVAGLVAGLLVGLVGWAVWPEQVGYTSREEVLTVQSGPDGATPVTLDTTFYLPDGASAADPVPSVLLAHGFGGTKESVVADAEELVDQGYAVLAWTARGFGDSGGQIHLNHPDYEVRDAQGLLDWLAEQPEVRTDGPDNPRVGVVGGSYGGALALLLAAADHRVDAIVPSITWHDLAEAFLPEATGGDPTEGVFKQAWAGIFFGAVGEAPAAPAEAGPEQEGSDDPGEPGGAPPLPDEPAPADPIDPGGVEPGVPGGDPLCARFADDLCRAYLEVAVEGRASAEAVARLRESSPAGVVDQITAPTLLIQGGADSLFPLAEADANARAIAAAGTPVQVAWFLGGHDGGAGPAADEQRLRELTGQWLDYYVAGEGEPPGDDFTWSRAAGFTADRGVATTAYRADAYPGLAGTDATEIAVAGPAQPVARPPGGQPAAVSSLPAAGGLASFVAGAVTDLPGQHARFSSEPLPEPVAVAGAPTVPLRVASPTGEAVLFVKLYDVAPDGSATLPGGLVAPVRLTGLPADIADAEPVTVQLPAIARELPAGHTLRLSVATTDQAYTVPAEPAVFEVAAAGPVTVPTVAAEPIPSPAAIWRWVLAGLVATLALGIAAVVVLARRRRRRADRSVTAEDAGVPLVVRGLRKAYADGFVAVSRVDLRVEPEQVVGLLGPNGAGKTTTLRVLLGLTRPTEGEVRVFGHRLAPGAPVLSRVGALVEGPGFLPHLSGLDNLTSYWRATGRPAADARFDEVLAIAGLGDAVHRRVRTYSHGMKQRLAVAQAMLGMPRLLLLDEPTDGLDPPQIAGMRRVLHSYATDGRAVLVSSHLLAEVEQTCTHVVVMHRGEVVASGPVADVVGDSPTTTFEVSDPGAAQAVLAELPGVRTATRNEDGLVADLDGVSRATAVAALVNAGIGVERVVPRRRLEDAFLALVGEDTTGSGDR